MRSSIGSSCLGINDIVVALAFSEQGPGMGCYNNIQTLSANYSIGKDGVSDIGAIFSPIYYGQSTSWNWSFSNDGHHQGGSGGGNEFNQIRVGFFQPYISFYEHDYLSLYFCNQHYSHYGWLCIRLAKTMTPTQWADEFDAVPLNTSVDKIVARFAGQSDWQLGKVDNFLIGSLAHVTPYGHTMYRQYPRGILLGLKSEDFARRVRWDDGFEPSADFVVFFNADHEYIGYFGYANNRMSLDAPERYEAEKKSYQDLKIREELGPLIDEIEKNHGYRAPVVK